MFTLSSMRGELEEPVMVVWWWPETWVSGVSGGGEASRRFCA